MQRSHLATREANSKLGVYYSYSFSYQILVDIHISKFSDAQLMSQSTKFGQLQDFNLESYHSLSGHVNVSTSELKQT